MGDSDYGPYSSSDFCFVRHIGIESYDGHRITCVSSPLNFLGVVPHESDSKNSQKFVKKKKNHTLTCMYGGLVRSLVRIRVKDGSVSLLDYAVFKYLQNFSNDSQEISALNCVHEFFQSINNCCKRLSWVKS